ncbi:MAG: FecR family protein [Bacteroidia bacterium]
MLNQDEIIAKYLSGNASEKEKEEVDAWRKVSHNEKLFSEYAEAWKITTENKESILPDTDEAWNAFKEKKDFSTVKRSFYWLVAATVIIPLLFFVLFHKTKSAGISQNILPTPQNNFIGEVSATDSILIFYLPDSSKVILNTNSRVFFPEKFYAPVRVLRLEGEAYFEVKHDTRPFVIYAGNSITKVSGTSFNLRAYRNKAVEVTVVSGSVLFSGPEDYNNDALILRENEKALMDIETSKASKGNVDNKHEAWWKDQVGNRFKKFLVKVKRIFKKEH